MANQKQSQKPNGYGKMSKKQWIVIYIIAGVVVYGLIYLLFIKDSGGGY